MNVRAHVAVLSAFVASIPYVRAAEAIDAPAPQLLRFMREADQVFVFPNPNPRKPRLDDKHMRLLAPEARCELIRLLGHKRDWYVGGDSRVEVGIPPKTIGLVFRRGRDELILFFYPGDLIDARFNRQRQPTRWSYDSYEKMERWKARYAQRELPPET